MSDLPAWRERILHSGIAIALLSLVYFFSGVNFGRSMLHSDRAFGWFIVSGFFLSVVALACGIVGRGAHRWKLILGAAVEAFLWWFMAVGA